MRNAFAALALAGLLSACSMAADMSKVDTGVKAFHQRLNAQDFASIYQDSSPDMRSKNTEADFTRLLAAIHRKLGAFQTGKTVSWNDNVNDSGHFVTLRYSATYDRGKADEIFVFRRTRDSTLLDEYNINSAALILN